MSRSGPREGYDFARKREYRRQVWATFRDTLKARGVAVKSAHALLMPSLEGDEIEIALNAGFREVNLHVVDREPAIVATLKRRYRHINTYGVTASRAVERIAASGIRLRCANFDFCNQISASFASELVQAALCGSYPTRLIQKRDRFEAHPADHDTTGFEDRALIAVSTLRGREPSKATELMQAYGLSEEQIGAELEDIIAALGDRIEVRQHVRWVDILKTRQQRDRQRLMFIMSCLSMSVLGDKKPPVLAHCELLRCNSYLSTSGQTMLWGIYVVTSPRFLFAQRAAADLRRVQLGMDPLGMAGLE